MARLSADDEAGAHRVAAFLMQYYGSGGQHSDLRAPLGAVTTHDRFALVTVRGVALPIVDIGMRMLAPHELQAAQGFPAAYDMTDGGRLTKTSQIRLIGNSVSPPAAAAVMHAQFPLAHRKAA
jgi:DNA (cytosine-5)-methyltransferase 1